MKLEDLRRGSPPPSKRRLMPKPARPSPPGPPDNWIQDVRVFTSTSFNVDHVRYALTTFESNRLLFLGTGLSFENRFGRRCFVFRDWFDELVVIEPMKQLLPKAGHFYEFPGRYFAWAGSKTE